MWDVLVLACILHGVSAVTPPVVRNDLADRHCTSGIDTSVRLQNLRDQMKIYNLDAYIILSDDEHQSEYVSEHDKRRKYISGFSGSYGNAVVTLKSAALWTDSRYYLQAEEQLDCNWVLQKQGTEGTSTYTQWILDQIEKGSNVSTNGKIMSAEDWITLKEQLDAKSIQLTVIDVDLVDVIWDAEGNRPQYPKTTLKPLDIQYAGITWQEKIKNINQILREKECDYLIMTALDEISWTLNIRGADILYSPVFISYLLLSINNKPTLYADLKKVTDDVKKHLEVDQGHFEIKSYEQFYKDMPKIGNAAKKVAIPEKYSYYKGVSYFIYNSLPEDKRQKIISPALLMKGIKNEAERKGMRNAHIRDGVALGNFLSVLEKEMLEGKGNWSELSIVEQLEIYRAKQNLNLGSSFYTIAAFGEHGALPHYAVTPETNKLINYTALLTIDSGGQYLDGTIDVTRTVHFGVPDPLEIEVYTRLLMGCINLATTVFPIGKTLKELDQIIRSPLNEIGLNYGHGSTHGIGAYLNVHEPFNDTYNAGFFGSQEPGYYKANDFGMRLENIIEVVRAQTKYDTEATFLTFDTITMAPYELKLIDQALLERKHIKWINNYHQQVLKLVGDEMVKQGLTEAYAWLQRKTKPIKLKSCDCFLSIPKDHV